MGKIFNSEILKRYKQGKYSYTDFQHLNTAMEEMEQHPELKSLMEDDWKETLETDAQPQSLEHVYARIHSSVLQPPKNRRVSFMRYYTKIAAVLLIPLLTFSLIMMVSTVRNRDKVHQIENLAWAEVNAPEGSRVEFQLPDGSKGWLNSGSKLRYPMLFGESRKVELEGEAYFEVEHKKQSDFVVHSNDLDVRVLGTKFNVLAYPGENFTSVVLSEGSVEAKGNDNSFSEILKPNEQLIYNRIAKKMQLKKVNAKRFVAWKDGYLIIDNEPLGAVVGRFERWYNVEINIEDEKLRQYRFKATFKDEPIEEVLNLIAETTPMKYSIQKRERDINGEYKKKRITLKLK